MLTTQCSNSISSHYLNNKFYIWSAVAYIAVCTRVIMMLVTEGQIRAFICPSKFIFHIPCPGCGVTRATMLFLSGKIAQAVLFNPNVLFAIGFLFGFPPLMIYDITVKRGAAQHVYKFLEDTLKSKLTLTLFAIFEALIWTHNIIYHI